LGEASEADTGLVDCLCDLVESLGFAALPQCHQDADRDIDRPS